MASVVGKPGSPTVAGSKFWVRIAVGSVSAVPSASGMAGRGLDVGLLAGRGLRVYRYREGEPYQWQQDQQGR